jgi:phenylacetate-CoA ligase
MFPEFGIVELIGKNGEKIKKNGDVGEIVGTGFHNRIFPFIRYKTGDIGVYSDEKCKCGRNYPLIKSIQGRSQEFVVSKSKQMLQITGIYGLIAKTSSNLYEYQLYQEKEGEIIVRIVRLKNYTNNDTINIINVFKEKLGNDFDIKIEFVTRIQKTKSGKHKFLIQKLRYL